MSAKKRREEGKQGEVEGDQLKHSNNHKNKEDIACSQHCNKAYLH